MRYARKFTEEEDEFIRGNIDRLGCAAIAKHLGRHTGSVSSRTLALGVRERNRTIRYFTPEEDGFIRENAGTKTIKEIADHLGRTSSSVRGRGINFLGCDFGYIKSKPYYTKGYRNIPIVRPDGKGCDWHREHIYVAEQQAGKKLSQGEIVHHINMDKRDNSANNLHIFAGHSQHNKAHFSLNKLTKELLTRGVIAFNADRGVYELCEMGK